MDKDRKLHDVPGFPATWIAYKAQSLMVGIFFYQMKASSDFRRGKNRRIGSEG
jgi:hypothetical protein